MHQQHNAQVIAERPVDPPDPPTGPAPFKRKTRKELHDYIGVRLKEVGKAMVDHASTPEYRKAALAQAENMMADVAAGIDEAIKVGALTVAGEEPPKAPAKEVSRRAR